MNRHELVPPPPLPDGHRRETGGSSHPASVLTFALVVFVVVALLRRTTKRRRSRAKKLEDSPADWVEIEAQYRSRCSQCRRLCMPGERILWHRVLRTVKHVNCDPDAKPQVRDVTVKALDQLASARGANRAAKIAAVLEQLEKGSPERQEFLVRLTEIEVAATLDKVDGLKRLSSKRDHLNKAIARLKGDELPDEIQKSQFELLRDALKTLDDLAGK